MATTTDVHTTSPSPASKSGRSPMSYTRKLALAGGVFYLLTFVFSIPTLAMKAPLDNVDFILGAGSSTGVVWAALFDFICGVAGIGTAVALYPVTRRVSRTSALGFVTSRVVEGAILVVGAIAIMAIVTLRQDLAGATGDVAASLSVTGRSLMAIHDWSFLFGPGFMPAFNALLLGSILYRSRLVPRWIPTLGLIGAPLLLVSSMGTLFDAWGQVSDLSTLLVLPLATWELSVGIYLTVKGFRPSPLTDAVDAEA